MGKILSDKDKRTGRMCGQRYNNARSTATDLFVKRGRREEKLYDDSLPAIATVQTERC